jgi:hypothetical protein
MRYSTVEEYYQVTGTAPASSPVPVPAQAAAPPGNMNLPNITYGDLIVNIDGKQLMKVGGIVASQPGRMHLTQRGIG